MENKNPFSSTTSESTGTFLLSSESRILFSLRCGFNFLSKNLEPCPVFWKTRTQVCCVVFTGSYHFWSREIFHPKPIILSDKSVHTRAWHSMSAGRYFRQHYSLFHYTTPVVQSLRFIHHYAKWHISALSCARGTFCLCRGPVALPSSRRRPFLYFLLRSCFKKLSLFPS